ncbi:MAG: hypothetical protein A2Y25_02965 [Candidatus Melainabacteria bacterium GWF2_37_15]|nr:MAG: hypothetical protein A2Y25_02965 [Candidatus Melainabacteria bacterium GWF2_37_15]
MGVKGRSKLALAVTISVLAFTNAFAAVNVSTEAQLNAALGNVAAEPTINLTANIVLTAPIVLPVNTYVINGAGFAITTTDGSFSIPANVTINNLVIDGTTNYTKNSKVGNGGAFDKTTAVTTISNPVTFTNNTVTNSGGAIYNTTNSTFTISNGATFTGNRANTWNGGAILNNNNSIFTINNGASFENNFANVTGGAIRNTSTSTFTISGGATFTGNSATSGSGAIYNSSSSTFTINNGATFTNNIAATGSAGAIFNDSNSGFTINGGATFTGNTANTLGGAIYNRINSTFTINNGATFTNNTATNSEGGAIYNYDNSTFTINDEATFTDNIANLAGGAIFNSLNSTFTINNEATFTGSTVNNSGGAIYNYDNSTFTINDKATFNNNTSSSNSGAIYNGSSSTFTIDGGASFTGNTANSNGGAIYSDNSTTTLIANTNNVNFTGNTANNLDNAIYLKNASKLNLNASNNANVVFNDGIQSNGNNNIININATGTGAGGNKIPVTAPTTGVVVLNADMSGFGNSVGAGNTVNLYGGTLSLGADGTFFNIPTFNATSGSTLSLTNGKIDTISLGAANIDNMNLKADVNLSSLTADKITATSVTNNDITINELVMLDKDYAGTGGSVTVDPGDDFDITLGSNAQAVSGKVYDYNVTNNGDGTLSFSRGNINPAVQAAGASQQAIFLNVANTNNVVFERADEVMNIMDAIQAQTGVDYRFVNKIATLEGTTEYSKLYSRLKEGSVWFRPFNSIENIDVNSLTSKVDSVSYGALVGFDSPLIDLRKGRKGMVSLYGGFSGASQEYNTVDLYQNGGLIGILGALYKGNFYTSLSTNIGGFGVVENIENAGSSNYGLFTTSVASKTGYNFHLPKEIVLQLNNQIAYSLVATQDHSNAQGTAIKSDPLHVIQLVPGVKLTKNIKGWIPYLAANMTFNPLNKSKVTANEVVLPESSLGSYVEYGAGIENHNEKGLSGFLQVMVRNGSRTGVNFKFGIKAPVGRKDPEVL